MATVVLIWIYVIATTYLTGLAFLKFVTSLDCMQVQKGRAGYKKYAPHYRESYIIAGIVVNTVYAQLFSLISGVGLAANMLLIAVCAVIAVYYRDELKEDCGELLRILFARREGKYYLLVFLIMAYGASHGIMHYDSDLYHAQAIHWIENYGVVKGLGNLHVRLAYNSSSFALSALYSFSFLTGRSFHCMAGFFALLLAWKCLDLKDIVRRGQPILSDFARIMAIYYLFTIYDEMVAPASDYFLSTIVFYIFIQWLDMNVRHIRSYLPYIMLALLGVYAVTIKLSAAPILLLSAIPIYQLFSNSDKKKKKAFGFSVLMAIVIVMPFIIRNVIISGWLVYPVTGIDLFKVIWKIPKGVAQYDAKEIRTFGRGYNDVAAFADVPFKEWIVNWFNSIHGFNKIMIILDMISIVIYIGCIVYFFVTAAAENSKTSGKVLKLKNRSMVKYADFLTLSGTMIACLIFWLFSAPLIRYGEVYVCLTFAIIIGRLLIKAYNTLDSEGSLAKVILRVSLVLFAVWFVYKAVNVVKYDYPRFNSDNLLVQQDYGDYEVDTFKVGNTVFYYPTEGDKVGYKPFPSSTMDMSEKMIMIGSGIKDGFMSIP
ncbi:LIC_10190 family membrane protein [Butyrivibrio sp. YAB3001]|uniref:LIC_10190 family membrane protein n=1 Tax=Butyrivibrio sp. YAB3001 TaxID=1520812 RepID=UPI0008F6503D|nr:hypothetical protein [Butyrivibrio sp. YAB3001]SFC17787.1 hypothetical protein SAMN02910398_01655 [Butyrivibrio sp. YAB3001]